MSLSDSDVAFNDFISDPSKGLVLFHDHFIGKPGAIAIFYIDNQTELDSFQNKGPIEGWEVQIFPLTFAELPVEFLYQIDFTLGVYRGKRLGELYSEYAESKYPKNIDEHLKHQDQNSQ
jgi:hypothetical protein